MRVRVRVHVVRMTDFDISPWLHPQFTLIIGSSALVHWSHSHLCIIVRRARPAHVQTCVWVYINELPRSTLGRSIRVGTNQDDFGVGAIRKNKHAAATAINHFFYL